MAKVYIGDIMIMWSLTLFLAMFWYYVPEPYEFIGDVFLILALISAAISFRISVTKKYK